MCRREPVPSGIRLQRLIQSAHAEILAREKNNDKFIHLYNIGEYWVAFEQSACRLNNIFQQCEITLFRVPARPEYVVMVSIPDNVADDYFRKHLVSRDGVDYKVLSAGLLETREYYKWHEVAVRSVLQ